jgi:hypothetical protein
MSVLRHQRSFSGICVISALLPKADRPLAFMSTRLKLLLHFACGPIFAPASRRGLATSPTCQDAARWFSMRLFLTTATKATASPSECHRRATWRSDHFRSLLSTRQALTAAAFWPRQRWQLRRALRRLDMASLLRMGNVRKNRAVPKSLL